MKTLCGFLFDHFWGRWVVRGDSGMYEKRWCRLCRDWQMRPAEHRFGSGWWPKR